MYECQVEDGERSQWSQSQIEMFPPGSSVCWVSPIRNQTPSNVAWEILMANRLVKELPQLFNSPLIWPALASRFKGRGSTLCTQQQGVCSTVLILKCKYTETGREWPSESTMFHLLFTRCQRAKVKRQSSTFLVYEIRQTFTITTAFAQFDHSAAQSANSPSRHPPCLFLTSPFSSSSLHHPPHFRFPHGHSVRVFFFYWKNIQVLALK